MYFEVDDDGSGVTAEPEDDITLEDADGNPIDIDDVIISYFVSGSDQLTFPIKVYGMVRGKISTQVYVVSSLLIFVVVAVWLIGMAVRASYQRRHPE